MAVVKNTLLIILLVCLSGLSTAYAQKARKSKFKANLPYFENDLMHFGFTLGTNTAGANIKYSLEKPDSLIGIQPASESGFNIGIVSSLRFTDHITLRFLPTLAFAQRNFDYNFQEAERTSGERKVVESTYLFFPLTMKFRSARYSNFAAYIIGGGNFGLDLSSQFDADNQRPVKDQVLKFGRQSIYAETGMGFDFFLEYFKFSVEFKYSHGLNNVLIQDDSFWAKPIDEITPKMFSISLHFEG